MKIAVLVDGQHYIAVTRAALDYLRKTQGHQILVAIFIGGMEKIGSKGDLDALGLPVILEDDPLAGIEKAIETYHPEMIIDLSDEPVVGYRERFSFANLILSRNVIYKGADFQFDPPQLMEMMEKPSLSFIGTGKRIGKTAVCAHGARVLSQKYDLCIVTMGRGGSAEPEVIRGDQVLLTPEYLVEVSKQGKHAASDHFEDAVMARVTTIGSRRCGGGFAGVVYYSNVLESARVANSLDKEMVLFEGSGAWIPPVKANAFVLIVGANQPVEYIAGYMGPYRVLLSKLVVLTLCEEPLAGPEKVREMKEALLKINPRAKVIPTIFRPKPLANLRGKRVVFTTTAPEVMGTALSAYLEEHYGCEIVGISHHLSNRPKLRADLEQILASAKVDVLLTEIKAASIDVAAKTALERGLAVAFCDNIPVCIDPELNLDEILLDLGERTMKDFYRERRG